MLLVLLMGLIAGIAGGMGMGGGTFLIPLLGFLDIPQKAAQAANLIGFLPMAAVALHFHFKNKLVTTKDGWFFIISALVFSAAGAVCRLFSCLSTPLSVYLEAFEMCGSLAGPMLWTKYKTGQA